MARLLILLIAFATLTACSCPDRTFVFENHTPDPIRVELWLGKSPYDWFTKTCAYSVEVAPGANWSTATAGRDDRAELKVDVYWLDQFWVYRPPRSVITEGAGYTLEFHPNRYARSKVATISIEPDGDGVAASATNEFGTELELRPIEDEDTD